MFSIHRVDNGFISPPPPLFWILSYFEYASLISMKIWKFKRYKKESSSFGSENSDSSDASFKSNNSKKNPESKMSEIDKIFKSSIYVSELLKFQLLDEKFTLYELAFYFFFIWDYCIFYKMGYEERLKLHDNFIYEINNYASELTDYEIKTHSNKRMESYNSFVVNVKKRGEFYNIAALYLSTMIIYEKEFCFYASGDMADITENIKKEVKMKLHHDLLMKSIAAESSKVFNLSNLSES